MRKLVVGAVVGVMSLAVAAVAFALTNNTATYTSKVTYKTNPKPRIPGNANYNGVLHVGTTDDKQPNSAPITDLFLSKYVVTNARYFPSCKTSEIDGKSAIPAKCEKARMGGGTAAASAGQPGQPKNPNLQEQLTATVYNGNGGKAVFLVLNGQSPVRIQNRVVAGTFSSASGAFGTRVRFRVPPDLQQQLGLQIALTDFNVNIKPAKTVKRLVAGKRRSVSYFQMKKCPKSHKVPTRAVVHFNDDAGNPSTVTATSNGTMSCK